ncbi:hypothetical protein A0H81_13241 [Grifola frondosa]|uniref:Uncharacterized protein n=1 Tax=Grifola frondosa TaxID=5627 RepID=A0A1C7LVL6_GRIFR|nr:hypothetical protein A0H81_13241 [Grifola frondosa]
MDKLSSDSLCWYSRAYSGGDGSMDGDTMSTLETSVVGCDERAQSSLSTVTPRCPHPTSGLFLSLTFALRVGFSSGNIHSATASDCWKHAARGTFILDDLSDHTWTITFLPQSHIYGGYGVCGPRTCHHSRLTTIAGPNEYPRQPWSSSPRTLDTARTPLSSKHLLKDMLSSSQYRGFFPWPASARPGLLANPKARWTLPSPYIENIVGGPLPVSSRPNCQCDERSRIRIEWLGYCQAHGMLDANACMLYEQYGRTSHPLDTSSSGEHCS